MRVMRRSIVFALVMGLFVSCSESPKDSNVQTNEELDTEIKEKLNEAEKAESDLNVDTSFVEAQEEELTDKELEVETEEAELKELSKVTFCDCVKKQKALDDRLMETEDDAEIDKIMAEMDELSAGECKNLLANNASSPEEREERKAKVEACLAN